MAPVPSAHRVTGPSSAVTAPTQSTALVHEFRCLYTRDLYKKAKKWHDGSLRFHTFNQRVMVYDDAKNYIGDLHYRQEEEFAEGVEIQLDRGVKVEVGERLGETKTDLAPILERLRPEKTSSQSRQAVALTSRPTPARPLQRPKSLLEVLGPSQRRLGPSRLQMQSPYDQRHAPRIDPAECAPKRRRLSSDKENSGVDFVQPIRPTAPYLPQPVEPGKLATHLHRQVEAPVDFEEVFYISSDDEPQRARLQVARLAAASSKGLEKSSKKRQAKSQSTLVSDEASSLLAGSKSPRGVLRTKQTTKESKITPKSRLKHVARTSSTSSSHQSCPRTARLLLSQPKARPKLSCLLPLPKSAQLTYSSNSPSDKPTLRRRAVASPSCHVPRSPSPTNANEFSIRPESFRSIPPSNSDLSTANHAGDGLGVSSSPLFVPEENPRPNPPSLGPLPTQDNFTLSGFEGFQEAKNGQRSPSPRSLDPQPEDHLRVLGWATPDTILTSDLASRKFRRVFSENALLQDEGGVRVPGLGVETQSPLELPESLSSRRSPVKPRSPATLQRCVSDTAATETDVRRVRELTEETGPWTLEEAFLLFDWFPPGLEKLASWASANETLPAVAAAGQMHPTGITTARQFLRDDVQFAC